MKSTKTPTTYSHIHCVLTHSASYFGSKIFCVPFFHFYYGSSTKRNKLCLMLIQNCLQSFDRFGSWRKRRKQDERQRSLNAMIKWRIFCFYSQTDLEDISNLSKDSFMRSTFKNAKLHEKAKQRRAKVTKGV